MFSFERPETVSKETAGHLDKHSSENWDLFYKRHAARFFRDRHYLHKELPALLSARSILEVGCGVGNTIFPLLDLCPPTTRLWACDFSPTAVNLVKANPAHDAARLTAFVADITCDSLQQHIPQGSIEFCTVVFVLSAIAPGKFAAAIRNIASVLVVGRGRVYVRDYSSGDLAEGRLHQPGRTRRLSRRAYCRNDGTRTYFFTEEEVVSLFVAEGFSCDWIATEQRTVVNRASGSSMDRRWVQASFTLGPLPPSQQDPPPAPDMPVVVQPSIACPAAAARPGAATSESTSHKEGGPSSTSAATTEGTRPGGMFPTVSHAEVEASTSLSSNEFKRGAEESRTFPGSVSRDPTGEEQSTASATGCDSCVRDVCEWEDDGLGGVVGSEVAGLFLEPPETEESCVELMEGLSLRVCSLERHHIHTQSHTGLLLWAAGEPLAQIILRCPRTFQWATVLEIGSGAAALPSIAATRAARSVVATDGSVDTLELMSSNLTANSSLFFAERLCLRRLTWGDPFHIAELQEEFPKGFDIIIGADVVYAAQHLALLFGTVATLLKDAPEACVLLCFAVRSISEDHVISVAATQGLTRTVLPSELSAACASIDPPISDSSVMRLLLFKRQTSEK